MVLLRSEFDATAEDFSNSEPVLRHLLTLGVPRPDYVFDACLLDRAFTRDLGIQGLQCPLHESGPRQYLSGCYVFVEEGTRSLPPEVIYVGKAARLRNRLAEHYCRDCRIFDDWADRNPETERAFLVHVAVWLTDERAALEATLIRAAVSRRLELNCWCRPLWTAGKARVSALSARPSAMRTVEPSVSARRELINAHAL